MDEAWRTRGIKNRMEFFRRALGHYLAPGRRGGCGALHGMRRHQGVKGAEIRRASRRHGGRDAPSPRKVAAIPSA